MVSEEFVFERGEGFPWIFCRVYLWGFLGERVFVGAVEELLLLPTDDGVLVDVVEVVGEAGVESFLDLHGLGDLVICM